MATTRAHSQAPPVSAAQRSRGVRAEPDTFAAVFQEHHQALYRYCRSILHHDEDAHDALQNTMARAFAALKTEERDFELRPWLFRIAHNESISLLRLRRPTAQLDAAAALGEDSLPRTVGDREQLALLQADLLDLPDRQRSALVMRELSGLTHDEIATALAISPSAAKQTIFEARSGLHQCREGRDMACEEIRRAVSDADGRVLRGRRVRAHLRSCSGCRGFADAIGSRPQQLAMLAPPLPAAAGAALIAQLLPGAKAATLGAKAAALGASSLPTAAAGGTLVTKATVAAIVVACAAGGGTAISVRLADRSPSSPQHSTSASPLTPGKSQAGGVTSARKAGTGAGARDSTPSRQRSAARRSTARVGATPATAGAGPGGLPSPASDVTKDHGSASGTHPSSRAATPPRRNAAKRRAGTRSVRQHPLRTRRRAKAPVKAHRGPPARPHAKVKPRAAAPTSRQPSGSEAPAQKPAVVPQPSPAPESSVAPAAGPQKKPAR